MISCSHPKHINGLLVPCGHCINCRRKHISDWTNKLFLEGKYYSKKCFATLTYNDENIPGDFKLHVRDYQLFLKRLRKQLDKQGIKIRYFVAGEYGKLHQRPHWHFIFFGIDRSYEPLIAKCWNLGFVKVETANQKTMRYVSKYVVKSFDKNRFDPNTGEMLTEITRFSKGKKGFFGKQYLLDHIDELSEKGYLQIKGFKYGLPRCFKDYLKKKEGVLNEQELNVFYDDISIIKGTEAIFNNHVKYFSFSDFASCKFFPKFEIEKELEKNQQLEKNYCARPKSKINYNDYYKNCGKVGSSKLNDYGLYFLITNKERK